MSTDLIVQTVEDKIAAYGNSAQMRAMVERIMQIHPGIAVIARKSPDKGIKAASLAAQFAIAAGASPIPSTNEIHVWVDNRDNLNVDLGINYWRRKADEGGGVWYVVKPRPMTEEERKQYGVDGEHDVAAIAIGCQYSKILEAVSAGIPFEVAEDRFSLIGTGLASSKSNNNGYVADKKSGRSVSWTAEKSAEKDLLKKIFPFTHGQPQSLGAGLQRDSNGMIIPSYEMVSPISIGDDYQYSEEVKDLDVDEINDDLFGSEPTTSSVNKDSDDDEAESNNDLGLPKYGDGSFLNLANSFEVELYNKFVEDSEGDAPYSREMLRELYRQEQEAKKKNK